jgi:hypothetical protein
MTATDRSLVFYSGVGGGGQPASVLFEKGATRLFAYKVTFKPFEDTFTNRPLFVSLYSYTETQMAPNTVCQDPFVLLFEMFPFFTLTLIIRKYGGGEDI